MESFEGGVRFSCNVKLLAFHHDFMLAEILKETFIRTNALLK